MNLARLFWLIHEQNLADAEAQVRRTAASGPGPALVASACLLGIPCRFDGQDRRIRDLDRHLAGVTPIPLCPEVLAGLGTPRSPLVLLGGDGEALLDGAAQLVDAEGRDLSGRMREAAGMAVRLVQAAGGEKVLLKHRSPTCGVAEIRTRPGAAPGCGVFTAALRRAGIQVVKEER